MSAHDEYCDVDKFAATLTDLIGEVFDQCDENVSKAVSQATKRGAKELRETYAIIGAHMWSDEYREGFKAHIDKTGKVTTGEIGNSAKPGLVHLLEKGHATLTGRRTRAYPHMEPTFEDVSEDLIERIDRAVASALRG